MMFPKKFIPCLFFILLICQSSFFAKELKYKIEDIPEALKENAKAVVRNYDITFEVKSPSDAVMDVTYAITILNENGIDNSFFIEYYDKFKKIKRINAVLYDEKGEKIKNIKTEDILDYSAISGFSIYEDSRVKYIDPEYRTIPFTVEYTYQIHYKGLLFFPTWMVYDDYNVSVEKSSFTVIVPASYTFRYFESNIDAQVEVSELEDTKIYQWSIRNQPALKEEPFDFHFLEYTPIVFTAPSDFEMDDYQGNCDSWKNFGKWINQLNENKDQLPIETQAKIKEMLTGIDDDLEKIEILYTYLQEKTRYVSIQIGIGGWQPFEAAIVDKYSYGDCKALTNYMKALLNLANIKSYYALVKAGSSAPGMIKEFPSSQFNHAFLYVPLEKDTLWLECTNQRMSCGYIGMFTDDRDVLVADTNGGKIVHTKVYNEKETQKISNLVVKLEDTGNGLVECNTQYKGLYYDNVYDILFCDEQDKQKLLYKRINLPNFEIKSYDYTVIKNRIPVVKEKLKLNIYNYGTFLGERMLVMLNPMNRIEDIPKKSKNRISDINIRRSYIDIDTVRFILPQNYSIEQIKEIPPIISEFGEYKTSVQNNDSEVIYIRYLKMNKGRYSKDSYDDLRKFYEDMYTADENKIILKKIED